LALARAHREATLVTTVKDWQRLTALLDGLPEGCLVPIPLRLDRAAVSRLADRLLDLLAERFLPGGVPVRG
jgi:hypothetical protein